MRFSALYTSKGGNASVFGAAYMGTQYGQLGIQGAIADEFPVTDLSQCQFVAITGAEFLAFQAAAAPAPTPMNVTADIFVGAALVLCFALGWIAGGQR